LLMLQGVTLVHKGLTTSGKIHPILRYLENKFVFLSFSMSFGLHAIFHDTQKN
jgi:hypothetical protein